MGAATPTFAPDSKHPHAATGEMQQIVYQTKVHDVVELKQRLFDV